MVGYKETEDMSLCVWGLFYGETHTASKVAYTVEDDGNNNAPL